MKRTILLLISAAVVCGCEKLSAPESAEQEQEQETAMNVKTKNFTFTVKGDFGSATFTRGYLQADGKDMTDLWVLDYMDGTLVQQLHQSSDDVDFGVPSMPLAYGAHHIYFVASRGESPVLNTTDHTLVWSIVRDTFYKDYEVSVVSTSNGNRAVTLDRVATKLRITVNDVVPDNLASISVTPSTWYYGLDYVTGDAISAQQKPVSVDVPSSYHGTAGELHVNIYGMSGADEWTTNVSIVAKDANNTTIGSATISGAPFRRNRATEYSGSLFGSVGNLNVSIDGTWANPATGTW